MSSFEPRDSLAMIPEHDPLDMVELGVEPIQRRVDAVERTRDPERLQTGERRERGDDRRCLGPLHRHIVPTRRASGKTTAPAMSKF